MTQGDPMRSPAILEIYHLPKYHSIPCRTLEAKVNEAGDVEYHLTQSLTLVSVWIYCESIACTDIIYFI